MTLKEIRTTNALKQNATRDVKMKHPSRGVYKVAVADVQQHLNDGAVVSQLISVCHHKHKVFTVCRGKTATILLKSPHGWELGMSRDYKQINVYEAKQMN